MSAAWYYAQGKQQRGPVSLEDLRGLLASGQLAASDLVWREGMATWAAARTVPELAAVSAAHPSGSPTQELPTPHMNGFSDPREVQAFASKKTAAGICGIFLGGLGVHKLILGLTTPGVIMLVVTLVGLLLGLIAPFCCLFVAPLIASIAMHIVGVVEGIIYLTKTDQDFYEAYAVQKKAWF